jgi:hypothetical protein
VTRFVAEECLMERERDVHFESVLV